MALKKKTQCMAIITPDNKNLRTPFLSTIKDFFFKNKITAIKIQLKTF